MKCAGKTNCLWTFFVFPDCLWSKHVLFWETLADKQKMLLSWLFSNVRKQKLKVQLSIQTCSRCLPPGKLTFAGGLREKPCEGENHDIWWSFFPLKWDENEFLSGPGEFIEKEMDSIPAQENSPPLSHTLLPHPQHHFTVKTPKCRADSLCICSLPPSVLHLRGWKGGVLILCWWQDVFVFRSSFGGGSPDPNTTSKKRIILPNLLLVFLQTSFLNWISSNKQHQPRYFSSFVPHVFLTFCQHLDNCLCGGWWKRRWRPSFFLLFVWAHAAAEAACVSRCLCLWVAFFRLPGPRLTQIL